MAVQQMTDYAVLVIGADDLRGAFCEPLEQAES